MATTMLTRREVAEMLGYRENTIDVYRRRTKAKQGIFPPFPEPSGYLGNRPWWTPEQIAEYKRLRDGPPSAMTQ
jgi:hypothetical protein